MLSISVTTFGCLREHHTPTTIMERSSGRPVLSPQSTPLTEVRPGRSQRRWHRWQRARSGADLHRLVWDRASLDFRAGARELQRLWFTRYSDVPLMLWNKRRCPQISHVGVVGTPSSAASSDKIRTHLVVSQNIHRRASALSAQCQPTGVNFRSPARHVSPLHARVAIRLDTPPRPPRGGVLLF